MEFEVLLLAVNYRNPEEGCRYVEQVQALEGSDTIATALVANDVSAAEANTLAAIQEQRNVFIYASKENRGYFGGAQWGLEQFSESHPVPDWVIVSNTDILFPDRALLRKLLALYTGHAPMVVAPDVVLDSDTLLLTSRKHQNPQYWIRPSARKMHLLKWLHRYHWIGAVFSVLSALRYTLGAFVGGRGDRDTDVPLLPAQIYAPFGAFMIFHRSYFERGGTFHHGAFLFGEEIFVAETVCELGGEVIYDPRLRVLHHGSTSMRHVASRQRARYARDALAYCTERFFSGPPRRNPMPDGAPANPPKPSQSRTSP
jgi:GT2 family glycosyltransferase